MIIMRGKYNLARVMLPDESYLDEQTKKQIQDFLNHPAMEGKPIVIMPDVHFGNGSCVGFTFPMNDYVIPEMVGVDIGCGIYSYNLGKRYPTENNLIDFDNFVRKNIPAGFSVYTNRSYAQLEMDIEDVYGEELGFNPLEEISTINSQMDGDESTEKRYYDSLGTLGGGNHFIELGRDEEENIWLTIHSGSRKFGLNVCTFHQKRAREIGERFFLKDVNYLHKLYGGNRYIDWMRSAQYYAHINRMLMLNTILRGYYHIQLDEKDMVQTVHNYIDFDDYIIRKGAVQANDKQLVVIPFNMEDGLIIGRGKGNPDWNFSAPHGAGRLLSRNQAKKSLSLDKAKTGMEKAGVFTTSLSESTLDEAKDAYKPKELILEMIRDTVDVVRFIKPIYNFKAK